MRLRYLFLPVLLVGCTKAGPAPVPTADFTRSRYVLETGEKLQLTNASQNAVRYEWRSSHARDSVKTDTNPAYFIQTTGLYEITLLAFNADGVKNGSTQTVKVGRRRIKWYRITSVDFVRPNGQPWHADGTSPNINTTLLTPAGAPAFSTNDINVEPTRLPILYSIDNNVTPLYNGTWVVQFSDNTKNGSPELLFTLPLVISGPPADRNADGNGTYKFQSGKWAVELEIETR